RAGRRGGDGAELAADRVRRVRLGVPQVDVARRALEIEEDQRPGRSETAARPRVAGPGAAAEVVGQAQAGERDGAHGGQFAAGGAVAQPAGFSFDAQHGRALTSGTASPSGTA